MDCYIWTDQQMETAYFEYWQYRHGSPSPVQDHIHLQLFACSCFEVDVVQQLLTCSRRSFPSLWIGVILPSSLDSELFSLHSRRCLLKIYSTSWFLDNPDLGWTPPADLIEWMAKARKDGKPIVYIGFGSITVPRPNRVTARIIKAVLKSAYIHHRDSHPSSKADF